MSVRYVTLARRPRAEWDDYGHAAPITIMVHETPREPINTGLVDQNGIALYRVTESEPMGFVGRATVTS